MFRFTIDNVLRLTTRLRWDVIQYLSPSRQQPYLPISSAVLWQSTMRFQIAFTLFLLLVAVPARALEPRPPGPMQQPKPR